MSTVSTMQQDFIVVNFYCVIWVEGSKRLPRNPSSRPFIRSAPHAQLRIRKTTASICGAHQIAVPNTKPSPATTGANIRLSKIN